MTPHMTPDPYPALSAFEIQDWLSPGVEERDREIRYFQHYHTEVFILQFTQLIGKKENNRKIFEYRIKAPL